MTDLTDITIVLDRSGSMMPIKKDTIGGFNEFIQKQRQVPGACNISLVQFDHEYEALYSGKPVNDAPLLDDTTYVPRGFTALLDAVGRTIQNTIQRIGLMTEKPAKVLFVVVTDGHENASKEINKAQLVKLIKEQTEVAKWEFVYLGATEDAFDEASRLGIAKPDFSNVMAVASTGAATHGMYGATAAYATSLRTSGKAAFSTTDKMAQDEERKKEGKSPNRT
jgi:hypothetical protein